MYPRTTPCAGRGFTYRFDNYCKYYILALFDRPPGCFFRFLKQNDAALIMNENPPGQKDPSPVTSTYCGRKDWHHVDR